MKLVAPLLLEFWSIYLHLLLAFTINLLWFQSGRAASAFVNETDQLALVKFKESTSIDPYGMLASWNSSNHFCNWHGVTCSPMYQKVTELNLQGYSLHGFISPHIGNLSFLRSLNLQNNSFYGEIPQELGRLFQLQNLSLGNNTLTGEIPANLTSCSELRRLGLQGNNLTGEIPREIGSLRKLQRLLLARNGLTGKIPNSMWNLSSLVVLTIYSNNLEGNIPEEIGSLKHLKVIGIFSNKLSGTLPSSLYNMSTLTFISATDNQFKGSLPANMFLTLPNLHLFEIGMNQISGTVPTSITNATLLERFDIANNSLVGQVPSLAKLQGLWWLNLGTNHLGSYSAKDSEFLESLQNCSKLEILDINSNNFGGPLPKSIGNFSTQLTELYLGANQLSGKIPATLGNHVNLVTLTMEYNNFLGMIPATFVKFQRMTLLDLSGNKLSGEIPAFLGNLSQLLELRMSKNMLEGNIPPSIGNCQHLQTLDLSNNNLDGVIPQQVIGLSSLTTLLNLPGNSLTGSLPGDVGKLKYILMLDVSKNQLSSDIPRAIGDCISLEYLNLQGNSFHGIIPSSLASVRGLQYLDLSQNNLSGSIPEGLQDISVLEYLNVSYNMLDGEVPTKGVFQNASMIAVIGNSKLCGGISMLHLPPCTVKAVKKRKHHIKLIAVIGCVVAFLILLSSMFAIIQMRKRKAKSTSDLAATTIDKLSMVSYRRLHQATNGFLASNLIGSGNFGSVYKGSLGPTDRVVAIKVLNLQKKGAHKSFIAECNALKNIRHRNLVKILTCCSSTDYKGQEFKALVFKYMENGDLDKWLHPEIESASAPRTLGLKERINILIDVASALHYLHHECELPVIHCDLKPNNILLDDDMVAHVGDFGLARLLSTINGTSDKQNSTIGIKGTIGYTAPEYGMGSKVSTEGDMYSFGILVLEMITGRRPTEDTFKDGHNLNSYVKMALPNNLLQIIDPVILSEELEGTATAEGNMGSQTLMHPNAEKCLLSLFRIGLACSAESSKERMSMMDVSRELNLVKTSLLVRGIDED